MKVPGYYTSMQLQKLLGVSKQRVHGLAKDHGWGSHQVGLLYAAAEVDQYLWSRWRRDLARQVGHTVNGLVTHDEWDRSDNCPICGAFAIWRPATADEIADAEINIYCDDWPWRCIRGHHN